MADGRAGSEASPVIKDAYELRILRELTSDEGRAEHDAGVRAALALAHMIFLAQQKARGTRVSGAAAADILRQCITRLHRVEVPSRHQYFGRYQWLWYLRRVPNLAFAGRLASTLPYDRALTEALAFAAARPAVARRIGDLEGHFPVTGREVRAVAWLIGYARTVAHLHASYRRCGKGARLILDAMRLLAEDSGLTECDAETAAAIEIYDHRLDASGAENFFGSDVVRIAPGSVLDGPGDHLRLFSRVATDDVTDVQLANGKPWMFRYIPHDLIIDELVNLIADPRLAEPCLWPRDITDTLGIIVLGGVVTQVDVAPEGGLVNTKTATGCGYVVIHEDTLRETWAGPFRQAMISLSDRFPAWAHQLDPDLLTLLRRAMAMHSESWPLRGHALAFQALPEHIGIDLAGAASRFLSAVRYPPLDGAVANARADMFERRVQARIDASQWLPPASLSQIRGRHLRHEGGKPFGEIDALAVRDGVCLVVSCKSKLYTDGHEVGDFRAIRSAEQKVTEAMAECDAFVEQLRAAPTGANYDLRGLQLHGVVVTPHVFFVRQPAVDLLTLPGLRAYSTLAELQAWLDSAPAGA